LNPKKINSLNLKLHYQYEKVHSFHFSRFAFHFSLFTVHSSLIISEPAPRRFPHQRFKETQARHHNGKHPICPLQSLLGQQS
jgi:hypothetical protein